MNTLPLKPSWEVPHSIGSIGWREAKSRYEVRLRERPNTPQVSTYVPGPRTPATYALAERELAERIAKSTRGVRHTGRTLTVGAWLYEWIELQTHLKGYHPDPAKATGSYRGYHDRIRLYLEPELGRIRLVDLEAPDVTRAMARLGQYPGRRGELLAPATVHAAYSTLRAALMDAWDLGKAPRNACRGANVPRPHTHIEPPTQGELDRLFAELEGDPYRLVLEVMRWSGCRVGEAVYLERRMVRPDGRITFRRQVSGSLKGKRPRTVVLPRHLAEELLATPARLGTDLMFATRTGRHIDDRAVLRHFDAACERAGIAPDPSADLDKYRPHDLRHAFATMALEAGVAPSIVIGWLGHASLAMLDRYSHVRPMPGGDAYRRMLAAWGPELEELGIRVAV
jgi:integrase